jgi:glycerol-3-phosphate dehydrogenase
MGKIVRQPAVAARDVYDVIIIGGGVYGVMLSMEASRRNLRSLLLERDDFGGATTANSLRIIHGGLRYLQSADIHRFRESVGERNWFLKTFSPFVKILPCLMPLYGNGLNRSSVMRLGLWANDILSYNRNKGVPQERCIPPGKVINKELTKILFPDVDTKGLKGGAAWHDAMVDDPQRMLMDIIRWSSANGATALNYIEAKELVKSKQGVEGVIAIDHEDNTFHEYRGSVVVNASGPWSREIASRFDRDIPELFRSSIAWNILFKKKALSPYALAVNPKRPGGQTYFLLPWKGMLLGGTGHASRRNIAEGSMPYEKDIAIFLNDLNLAIPSLDITRDDILRIFSGFLPVAEEGGVKLTTREILFDHGSGGGPRGLYSISGIKFTTARLVAEKTLKIIFPEKIKGSDKDFVFLRDEDVDRGVFDFHWLPEGGEMEWESQVRTIIEEESVLHLDDLILRRTSIGDNPERALKIAPVICDLFGWDESRSQKELLRFNKKFSHTRHN